MKTLQKVLFVALAGLGVAMFATNLALVRKNRELRTQLDAKLASLEVKPGTVLPPIQGTDAEGRKLTVAWDGRRDSLLMIFSTMCPFCEENWPNWVSLTQKADLRRVNTVLVDLFGNATEGFLQVHGVSKLPLVHVDPAFVVSYNVRFVPETVLVGPDGRVIQVWAGVLQRADEDDILQKCQNQFAVQVPID